MGKYKSKKFVSFSDQEVVKNLLQNLKPVTGNPEDLAQLDDEQTVPNVNEDLSNLAIGESKICSLCSITFAERSDQRQHFKLDWHRYNLKRRIQNKLPVTEDHFDQIAETSNKKFENSNSLSIADSEDDTSSLSGSEDMSESDEDSDKIDSAELLKMRHPKYFFRNTENQTLSVYKCVFVEQSDKSQINDSNILSKISKIPSNGDFKWAILMLGGGHFAGAVFKGTKPLVHKTFHCYTVRAKQGGSQSMADNKSGTNHPKSAGASLRRYNQAALEDHVRSILSEWQSHLQNCDLLFYRAVSGNRNVLFGEGHLDKKDPRLRTIPFPTRRATFTEVKRVLEVLSSVQIHSDEEESQLRESLWSEGAKKSPNKSANAKKSNIRRSKSRDSPKRQLPKIVQSLAEAGGRGQGIQAFDDSDLAWDVNVNVSTSSLSEFENTAPPPRRPKKKPQAAKNQEEAETGQEPDSEETSFTLLKNELVTACKSGNEQLLKNCLDEANDQLINVELGSDRWTPLHLAAQSGKKNIVAILLERGADPTKRNRFKQVPYSLCPYKETRNCFRRFQAEYPDKFDYAAALIPVDKPLTVEEEARQAAKKLEKKKAQRAAKKERDKESKAVEEEKRKEEEEKKRFLNLSDREKRALAAERRILESSGSVTTAQRCYQCGIDITGQVPFTYLEYRFCKPACVKLHRQKAK